MLITLLNPTTLSIAFAFHPQTVTVVKSLPGTEWDKATKTWSAPLHLLRRLVSLYPEAQVERACVEARLELWRRWVQQFNDCGVWFGYAADGETVQAVGNVSPVFQEWTAAHSTVLAQFLGEQHFPSHTAPPPTPVVVESSPADELIWSGIVNARGREERRAETIERVKTKRWKVKAPSDDADRAMIRPIEAGKL